MRTRACDNPVPAYGRDCVGHGREERSCNTDNCPGKSVKTVSKLYVHLSSFSFVFGSGESAREKMKAFFSEKLKSTQKPRLVVSEIQFFWDDILLDVITGLHVQFILLIAQTRL